MSCVEGKRLEPCRKVPPLDLYVASQGVREEVQKEATRYERENAKERSLWTYW